MGQIKATWTLATTDAATDWLDVGDSVGGRLAFHLIGSGFGTITFEAATIDPATGARDVTNKQPILATSIAATSGATTTTAAGIYVIEIPAGLAGRARLSTASGSVVVRALDGLG